MDILKDIAYVKRETGESPVRSRRCNKRVVCQCHCLKGIKQCLMNGKAIDGSDL